jgi:hypothetical protein
MRNTVSRALTLAATHYVDGQLINFDADEVYPRLKTLSQEGNCLLASEITEFSVSADYQNLTVTELVERIEVSANQMVAFGNLMLKAAHAGLVDAAIDGGLDSDANAWHLPSFAEACI